MVQLLYHPNYNIGLFGLERLHPFDSRKYARAWRLLERRFGTALRRVLVRPDRQVDSTELRTVHSTEYLSQLRSSRCVARALELPVLGVLPAWLLDWCVLRPMRWATRGTMLAAEAALKLGFAVNLSGGYHHAKPGGGEGFCIYSDIVLAIRHLRAQGLLGERDRVAYIDLDAHQGNGVCHGALDDPSVFIFDMFNADIYPVGDRAARDRIDCPIPLDFGCADADYLRLLKTRLPAFLDGIAKSAPVRLVIYNAGTDIYEGDALGGLNVSAAGVLERDVFTLAELKLRQLPAVMVLSGGYSRESHRLVARSLQRVFEDIHPLN